MSTELYVGLMSGTSLDGVDAVLVDLAGGRPRLMASARLPFEPALREELLALNSPGENEIERAALAGNELARSYAAAVGSLDIRSYIRRNEIRALGCHGQTVRHRPERGYTVQLGSAALLAELTGLCVVCDFRSRDLAAGGQGAPLVPAFHAAVFADRGEDRAVLNLGGIANLTWLPRSGEPRGFDSGPGNCLLDLWASRHLGKPFDEAGEWAAGGRVDAVLLARLLDDPYFAAPPPKSTGRDRFNERWLRSILSEGEAPRDVQATLLELSACSIAGAIAAHCPEARRVIACGGGVMNRALMIRLAEFISPASLESSERHGIEPRLVEAVAFAWLAKQALDGKTGNVPAVTGARGARVLGAVYPA